jgi:anaerobic ribonucleoside-triphosphate reductase activating protein
MYYGAIKYNDIANGEGIRTSLFVSGCRLKCKDCFNTATWAFDHGHPFTGDVENQILKSLQPGHVSGLTVLGGEPMEEENQAGLLPFLKKVKEAFPSKNIWLYSGYLHDVDLVPGGRKHTPYTDEILSLIDVMVDGPFVSELKDITLKFRGSSNQRLLTFNHVNKG